MSASLLSAVVPVLLSRCCHLCVVFFVLLPLWCDWFADSCAVILMLVSLCCCHSVVISHRRRQALPYVMNDAWRLTFINNANACLLFVPAVFFFEGAMLWEVRALGGD